MDVEIVSEEREADLAFLEVFCPASHEINTWIGSEFVIAILSVCGGGEGKVEY